MNNIIQHRFNHDIFGTNLFDTFFGSQEFYPEVDLMETEQEYQIQIELPSVEKKDIEITLKDCILTISGEKIIQREGSCNRLERRSGKFARAFRLPKSTEASKINANLKDGVLSVIVPKAEEQKPRRIDVT